MTQSPLQIHLHVQLSSCSVNEPLSQSPVPALILYKSNKCLSLICATQKLISLYQQFLYEAHCISQIFFLNILKLFTLLAGSHLPGMLHVFGAVLSRTVNQWSSITVAEESVCHCWHADPWECASLCLSMRQKQNRLHS